jgi:hypothetical protein
MCLENEEQKDGNLKKQGHLKPGEQGEKHEADPHAQRGHYHHEPPRERVQSKEIKAGKAQ